MGTGLGSARRAADTRAWCELAFRRALRWIFRKIRAAALWAMIRARVAVLLALAMIRAGAGYVPNEIW